MPGSEPAEQANRSTGESIVADINVERKGPSVWPWIIGLVVVALLIWALTQMFGPRETVTPVITPTDTPVVAPDTPVVPQDPVPGATTVP
jgi:hypothetical protein